MRHHLSQAPLVTLHRHKSILYMPQSVRDDLSIMHRATAGYLGTQKTIPTLDPYTMSRLSRSRC